MCTQTLAGNKTRALQAGETGFSAAAFAIRSEDRLDFGPKSKISPKPAWMLGFACPGRKDATKYHKNQSDPAVAW
jgi:hypothetical protein